MQHRPRGAQDRRTDSNQREPLPWRYWLVLAGGAAAFGGMTAHADPTQPWPWLTFVLLTLSAIVTDWLFSTEPSDPARNLSAPFLLAGILLLPDPPLVLMLIAIHVTGALRWRPTRHMLAFDFSAWLIGVTIASLINQSLQRLTVPPLEGLIPLLSTLFIAATLTLCHRLLVTVALRPVQETTPGHLFSFDNLLTQFIVLLLGLPVAMFWHLNPWLTVAAVAPLFLIHRALNVPALEKEARTDTKTGLHNMRSFNEALGRELQRASRFGHPVSVLMVDLDLLRHVNNAYGHQAGDSLLRGVANALQTQIREYDVAARFGGDEFVVLLVECDSDSALQVAERIRRLIEAMRFEIPTSVATVGATVSIGAASFPRHGGTPEEIIYQADQAVYRAKLGGRNRVCLAPPPNRSAQIDTVEEPKPPVESDLWEDDMGAPVRGRPTAGDAAEDVSAGEVIPAGQASIRPRARRLGDTPRHLQILIALAVIAAAAMLGLALHLSQGLDWLGLAALVFLTIAAELWIIDIYGDSSVSLMIVPIMTAAMLFGVPGGAIIGLTAGLVRGIMRRSQLYRVAFNTAVFVLGATLSGVVFRLFVRSLTPSELPLLLAPALGAAIIYYAINTSLISLAMGLSSDQSPVAVWRDHFRWLLIHYIVFGVLSLFLATAYTTFGLYGIVAFVAPVVAMRYAMHQYISNTTEHVAELRRLNAEMQRSNEEMARINEDLLNTLAAAIDVRDPYVYGHSTKVAEYAVAIAKELHLSSEMVELIRQAALLHDIGKLGIAEAILHKPARLDPDEYETVKTHALLGADLLTKMRRLQHLVPAIKHHHEWYNGKGYPVGLAREEIPIEARILAVSDAIEAMASDRPYHKAMATSQIIAELQRCAGAQFDPTAVEAFVRVSELADNAIVSNSALTVRQREARLAPPNGSHGPDGLDPQPGGESPARPQPIAPEPRPA